MKTPLLTISIPTYNRAHYLEDCLNSINIQLDRHKELQDIVEVVISDNASTDSTKEVAEKYRDSFKNFVYIVNEKNLGFDLNIFNVVKNSSGVYCWYLADDDVLINGSIDYIIEKLQSNKYDVITMGSSPVTEADYRVRKTFNNNDIHETKNADEFFHGNHNLGGVSNLLFNRESWMKSVDVENHLPYWLYNETVLKIFTMTDKKMLNVLQTLIYTGQDCRWSENGAELFTFINSNLMLERVSHLGFDKKRIDSILEKNRKLIPIILLRAKGHGLDCNFKNLDYIYKNLSKVGILYLSIATILYFIPNKIIILIRDLRKKMKKW